MKLGTQAGLGPGHLVLDGDPAPSPKKGHSPQFSANVRWSQTAGWINVLLGKVGLRPDDFVRWGPAPPKKGAQPPPQLSVHVYCVQTAGWIKMPLGTEAGLDPGDFVLDGDPALPQKKGAQPPNFRPMSIVAKRLDGSRCHLVGRLASAQATVLDWDPVPHKGAQPLPIFGACLLWPKLRLTLV